MGKEPAQLLESGWVRIEAVESLAAPSASIEPQLDASAETVEEVGPEDLFGIERGVRPSIVYCSELLLVAYTHEAEVRIAQRKFLEEAAEHYAAREELVDHEDSLQ